MRCRLVLSVSAFLFVASACTDPAPATQADPDAGTPGDAQPTDSGADHEPISDKVNATTETIDVDGTAREYVLAVPKQLEVRKPYPLVLVFHGDGGTGAAMRKVHTFDAVSADEAIVAYPSGIDQGWDVQTPSASNRDMKFVDALVKALSEKYPTIDTSRVFASGYSSGAFLINKIACRKTGFFRGIVSHAGGAPYEEKDPDATEWPSGYTKCAGQSGGVAALVVHGDADTTVTPDSGDFTAVYWAALNGCQDTRSDTTPSPCQKFDGCPTEKPVTYCLVPGLGHTVWEQGATAGWAFLKAL